MNELAKVLDELVADAPVDRLDWDDVLDRSREIRGPRRARRRLALALAVASLLVLAGTAVAVGTDLLTQQERFHADLPDGPQRLGPLVEITSGDDWALIAWQSSVGICLDFAVLGNSPFGCGFPVRGAKPATDTSGAGPPVHAVAGFVSGGGLVGGDGKTSIFGVAAHEVEAVEIELRDGRILKPVLYDAPAELGVELPFFIVRLPLPPPRPGTGSPVRFYRAYDHDGGLIERIQD